MPPHRPRQYGAHIPSGPNPTARRPLSKAPRAQPAPVPLHPTFDAAQAEKAVVALLKHQAAVDAEREKTQLLEGEGEARVFLVVNTKRGRSRQGGLKPVRM